MRSLYFLAAGMFTMGCDDYVVAGLLPGLGKTLGASMAGVAQGITAFSFTYLVCAPLFAVLLARKPARQVLILALVIFAAGNGMTLLAPNLAAYLVSRAIAGIGAGMYLPIAVAAAAELVAPEALGRALGLIWGANSAGAVVGVPAGLWLAARFGWQATIGLILALGTVTLLGIAIRQPKLPIPAPPSLGAQLRFLVDRRVLSTIGVTCLTATASLGLYDFVAPLMAGSADAALTVWNVGGLLGSTAIGFLEDRIGNPRAVMAGILVTLFAAVVTLPFVGAWPILGLLPFLVWGAMGWATMTPQQMSLAALEPGHETTVVALNSSAVGLGSVFGPALGGLALAGGLDVRTLPYAAGGLLLCALAWQVASMPRRQPEQEAA
ncbi:MAG TPA: MFS transporter [Oscillatoriaceae cyanobacterium]